MFNSVSVTLSSCKDNQLHDLYSSSGYGPTLPPLLLTLPTLLLTLPPLLFTLPPLLLTLPTLLLTLPPLLLTLLPLLLTLQALGDNVAQQVVLDKANADAFESAVVTKALAVDVEAKRVVMESRYEQVQYL